MTNETLLRYKNSLLAGNPKIRLIPKSARARRLIEETVTGTWKIVQDRCYNKQPAFLVDPPKGIMMTRWVLKENDPDFDWRKVR